jgi:hypothetical protein
VPSQVLADQRLYGDTQWQDSVARALAKKFNQNGEVRIPPRFHAGPSASSDTLIKDAELAAQWRESSRHVASVEMELAGAFEACQTLSKQYPLLAIRGISDIIGLQRDEQWTEYACYVAAAFLRALLQAYPFRAQLRRSSVHEPPPLIGALEHLKRADLASDIVERISRYRDDPVYLSDIAAGEARALKDLLDRGVGLRPADVWALVAATSVCTGCGRGDVPFQIFRPALETLAKDRSDAPNNSKIFALENLFNGAFNCGDLEQARDYLLTAEHIDTDKNGFRAMDVAETVLKMRAHFDSPDLANSTHLVEWRDERYGEQSALRLIALRCRACRAVGMGSEHAAKAIDECRLAIADCADSRARQEVQVDLEIIEVALELRGFDERVNGPPVPLMSKATRILESTRSGMQIRKIERALLLFILWSATKERRCLDQAKALIGEVSKSTHCLFDLADFRAKVDTAASVATEFDR